MIARRQRRQRRGTTRLAATVAVLAICALGLGNTAHAGSAKAAQRGAGVPYGHRYATWERFDPPARSFSRRSGLQGAPPIRRRTESVLRYETPLGKTGLILRLKAPLKPRRLVKFELRF